ncbi:MAG: FHA domain-containing protein [Tannerella sp.]|jgi:pSer/pThr/pTyr-binding forkhead associated (FHA) protein|nr:FHA domain-containing protein [Tannerella sp.]
MISVKCPHCQVGLKVDENKIPKGIASFKCPRCKRDIPLSYVDPKAGQDPESDTVVITPQTQNAGLGRLTVLGDSDTTPQEYKLSEGMITVGREAKVSKANICIRTEDKTMSRSHIRINVKKNPKGNGYFYHLSDNNSKNHTLYNGKCIESGDVVVLKDNDEIIMGRTVVRFNE